jgi:hypothetical protein
MLCLGSVGPAHTVFSYFNAKPGYGQNHIPVIYSFTCSLVNYCADTYGYFNLTMAISLAERAALCDVKVAPLVFTIVGSPLDEKA